MTAHDRTRLIGQLLFLLCFPEKIFLCHIKRFLPQGIGITLLPIVISYIQYAMYPLI